MKTERFDNFLRLSALRYRTRGSTQLAQDLNEATGVSVCPSTVRRHLTKQGLHGRVAHRKLLLRRGNRQQNDLRQKPPQLDSSRLESRTVDR
ncbi:Transposase [Popillia japonica]|uniref:Transposase n=1 Tax=Popillia japonica TaxID=7064 RepID=A0AAW1JGQ9_POPJA